MALLKREAILAANDVEVRDVEVPEWGGAIRVRSMTVAERNEFAARAGKESNISVGTWLVSRLAIDEEGNPVFKPEDVAALEAKNAKALDRLVSAVLQLNSVDEKKVDEAEKT
jgi:hypothetical protein